MSSSARVWPAGKDEFPPDNAARRVGLAEDIAGIVLREGLDVLVLRGLAQRLGTSARMLMYYFGSKENLVVEAVGQVMLRLQALVTRYSEGPPQPPALFLARALALTTDPEIAPFMRVLTELIARGGRGEAPYDRIAHRVVAVWTAWIDSRLTGPQQPGRAAALLGIVEGITLLEMAARGSTEAAGPYLLQLFEAAVPDGQ